MSGGFQGKTPPPGYTPPPPQVIQMLRQAFGLHQQGQLAQAETLYREVLTMQPDNPDALHFLGVLELQRGRREAGLSLIDRAVKVNPRNTAAFYNRAGILRDMARLEEALAELRPGACAEGRSSCGAQQSRRGAARPQTLRRSGRELRPRPCGQAGPYRCAREPRHDTGRARTLR